MDPTERFSGRADVYAQARPSYPHETLDILRAHYDLDSQTIVADLGSGTGIFTRLLLDGPASRVYAVEPNLDMRRQAERTLGGDDRFRSIAGRAEETTLADASVDLVTAAQAFHWFDLPRFTIELRRILRPMGHAAFVWNDRVLDGSPFLSDYEAILVEHCPSYPALQGKANTPAKFDDVFGRGRWSRQTTANAQRLDRAGLARRVMSASYAPSGEARDALVRALDASFDRHAMNGEVTLRYATVVIGGAVGPA